MVDVLKVAYYCKAITTNTYYCLSLDAGVTL